MHLNFKLKVNLTDNCCSMYTYRNVRPFPADEPSLSYRLLHRQIAVVRLRVRIGNWQLAEHFMFVVRFESCIFVSGRLGMRVGFDQQHCRRCKLFKWTAHDIVPCLNSVPYRGIVRKYSDAAVGRRIWFTNCTCCFLS